MVPESVFQFVVMELEGGSKVTDHPADPGGLTKYGICQRSYPDLDIRSLREADARLIYTTDYWNKAHCQELQAGLALAVFDAAVNQGVKAAIRLLQGACGAKVDGHFGPETRRMANESYQLGILLRFMQARASRYLSLNNSAEEAFERGWINRLLAVTVRCVQLMPR